MKKLLLVLLFVTATFQPVFSQSHTAQAEDRVPKLIVGTDFGFQWFNTITRFSSLKIEYPINQYQHLGFHFSTILSGYSNDYNFYDFGYDQNIESGSFELGVDAKFFPHGRFTGRKTGFYIGSDIRLGKRKYTASNYDFQTNTTVITPFHHSTSKFMFTWGVQWRLGRHIVFDLGAPIGVEYYFSKDPRSSNNNNSVSRRNFAMLPTIMMGFAF